MERLSIYKFLYVVSLVLFLFFSSYRPIDSVIALLFIGGTIALIFRREESTDDSEVLVEYPDIHYYNKKRYNPYTYSLAFAAIIVALVFYLLQYSTEMRVGLITLLLWPVIIIVAQIVSHRINKSLDEYLLIDYIRGELPEDNDLIELIVKKLGREKDTEKIDVIIKSETDWPKNIRDKFLERYIEYSEYLENAEKNPVISDEIDELNDE
jgi:ABC-type multidrug transport system fused ATPase/permease subunit